MSLLKPGEVLKKVLKEKRMTQTELAKLIGFNDSTVSRIIDGKQRLTVEVAVLLERALGGSAESWIWHQLYHDLVNARDKLGVSRRTPSQMEFSDL